MQRKNHILNQHRRGIAMIMAIAVILILSTIMALTLQMTTQTTKQTTNDYLHEQAILLTRSATEYTLLRISDVNRSAPSGCLTNLNGTYNNIYDINISWQYIGLSDECTTAGDNYINVTDGDGINDDVDDDNSRGSILLDVIVSVNDENVATEPIRYHRRTLQKL